MEPMPHRVDATTVSTMLVVRLHVDHMRTAGALCAWRAVSRPLG